MKVTVDARPYQVEGDGVLLERLVRNLVHNAIKYNRPGGSVTVTVGAADSALTVLNTGPMVPAEDVARLFEPFTRLATGRIDHSGGSGLGLAIARSIVQAHERHDHRDVAGRRRPADRRAPAPGRQRRHRLRCRGAGGAPRAHAWFSAPGWP